MQKEMSEISIQNTKG